MKYRSQILELMMIVAVSVNSLGMKLNLKPEGDEIVSATLNGPYITIRRRCKKTSKAGIETSSQVEVFLGLLGGSKKLTNLSQSLL